MYGEGKGGEEGQVDGVDDEADGVEPLAVVHPLVVEEAGHQRVLEQVDPLALHLPNMDPVT